MDALAFGRLLALSGFLSVSYSVTAANLTITDACSQTVSGSMSSTSPDPVSVDSSGNVTVVGYTAGSFTVGLGQCDPLPGDGKPVCTLSASQTRVPVGGSTTIHAKCTASTASLAWAAPAGGPAISPNPGTANTVTLTFPAAGTYAYHVTGTSTSSVAGWTSSPLTILVGSAGTDKPNCELTFSPGSIPQGNTSNARVVCQPEATSYSWDAAESGAPAAPSSTTASATLGPFTSAGAFTYKVAGINASGTGPKTGTTIAVASTLGCTSNPVTYDLAAPGPFGSSQDFINLGTGVIAFSISLPANHGTDFRFNHVAANGTYYLPHTTWAISQCKGDFTTPTGACNQPLSSDGTIMTASTNALYGGCVIQPGVTYYLNIKQTSCSPSGPGGCGFYVYENN